MATRSQKVKNLEDKRRRLELYRKQEENILTGGVQQYNIGSRNLARYGTSIEAIQTAIKALEEEITMLENELDGIRPRKAAGVIPRDNW